MRILGLESAGKVAGVGLVEDGILLGEFMINNQMTHSQTLMPMIKGLLEQLKISVKEIDGIAISKGPGSFTGLRIGSGIAKGLSLALDCPIIPVSTLMAKAYQCYGYRGLIVPLMNARRGKVYSGLYRWQEKELLVLKEDGHYDLEEYLLELREVSQREGLAILFLGDGSELLQAYDHLLSMEYDILPEWMNVERGASIAALGYSKAREAILGQEFVPTYLRSSQAEREKASGIKHYQEHISHD